MYAVFNLVYDTDNNARFPTDGKESKHDSIAITLKTNDGVICQDMIFLMIFVTL